MMTEKVSATLTIRRKKKTKKKGIGKIKNRREVGGNRGN